MNPVPANPFSLASVAAMVAGATAAKLLFYRSPFDIETVLLLQGPAGLVAGQYIGFIAGSALGSEATQQKGWLQGIEGNIEAGAAPIITAVIGGFLFVIYAGEGTFADALLMTAGSYAAMYGISLIKTK